MEDTRARCGRNETCCFHRPIATADIQLARFDVGRAGRIFTSFVYDRRKPTSNVGGRFDQFAVNRLSGTAEYQPTGDPHSKTYDGRAFPVDLILTRALKSINV
jgi:hypothetical protein